MAGGYFFVDAIGEGEVLPATALEVRAPFRIPVVFATEKDHLPALTFQDDPSRTKDEALRWGFLPPYHEPFPTPVDIFARRLGNVMGLTM